MDLDDGASITVYAHKLAQASLDNIVLEEVEFVDLEGLGLQPPKNRFKELSTNKIDKLPAQRTEKSTDRQTSWAVKLFRGKYWQLTGLFIDSAWSEMAAFWQLRTSCDLWPVPIAYHVTHAQVKILATKCGPQSKCSACHKKKKTYRHSL